MNIRSMSLTAAKQSDEVVAHLRRLRHEHGWFRFLLENKMINSNEVLVLLASEGGHPVGALYAHGPRVGIFVDPTRRRQGVGTMLMDKVHQLLGSNLRVVFDDNVSMCFFASLRRDMHLCVLPSPSPDWTP